MIIAIPVSEKNLKEDVCVSFGRAPYYYVLDSNKGEGSFLKNPAVDQPGGAGIMSSQILINNKVKVLITKSCGENAANVLRAANVEILKASTPGILAFRVRLCDSESAPNTAPPTISNTNIIVSIFFILNPLYRFHVFYFISIASSLMLDHTIQLLQTYVNRKEIFFNIFLKIFLEIILLVNIYRFNYLKIFLSSDI